MTNTREIVLHKDGSGVCFKNDFDATGMLLHMETHKGVTVVAKKSWILTDDFEGFFNFKGYLFVVETPFAEVEIMAVEPSETPPYVINEVIEHAKRPVKHLFFLIESRQV